MSTLMDRAREEGDLGDAAEVDAPTVAAPNLPGSAPRAMLRGIMGRCPRCGEGPLFAKFLKPVDRCRDCSQDWSLQCADDFPAYVSIFVTGHLMAPVIIALVSADWLSTAATATVVLALSLVLLLATLQPAKGMIIALQWWFGMHGFDRSGS